MRSTKEELAIHYLASHNVNDLEMHLGLSLRFLYYGVRSELDPNEEMEEWVQARVEGGPGPNQEEIPGLSMIPDIYEISSASYEEKDD